MTRRNKVLNALVGAAALVCAAALIVGIYPGMLVDLIVPLLLLSFVLAIITGFAGLVVLVILAVRGDLFKIRIPWLHAGIVVVLLFGTYTALRFYLPRRIAFRVSRPAFERLVSQAPQLQGRGAPLNQWCGAYHVDEYAADPRGGVYFRVYTGADGIGPDQMSYGFAYNPNNQGTPFGAARYRVFRLGNNWHWFRASDDWH